MKSSTFYKKYLKDNNDFEEFIDKFLNIILSINIDKSEYKQSFVEYLFYDQNEFLYKIKYHVFREVNSEYLVKFFKFFETNNFKFMNLIWETCEDKEIIKKILTHLAKKRIELLKTITMPSFKSLENDVQTSEIVTNMLNSIVSHLQHIQKNQNLMLANISHEMRTPLNSVIGYLDVLDVSMKLNPDDKKNVIYAKNSSKLLLTLINDLLDTQKLASATLDLVSNPFWINKVIKNAVLISSINANQKNIEFIYNDNSSVFSEVIGDKNRFLQILNNLFSNAVKFTPEHGKISLIVESEDLKDSIKLKLSVKDSGIGIAKSKQKELFKPFSRATNKEKGTGLGLYISKQLSNRMGGNIWFESEEGKGSTFFLELTFKKSNLSYDVNIMKNKKFIFLKNEHTQSCKTLIDGLSDIGGKSEVFHDEKKFMEFLLFNKDIDIAFIVYPHKIERDDLDLSFIKTYKKMSENNNLNTTFIAILTEEYYPENIDVFDKVISMPVTILDIIENFTNIQKNRYSYKYLIIDDEPMNRMVLSTMIKTFDKKAVIEISNDGIDGLDKIIKNKYDLIFLDKRMPKMGGYEVLQKLDELQIKANIYLLTADGDAETIAKTKEFNVGYIAKPVTLSTLKSVVSSI